jgi:hypothetical protein
MTIQGWHLTDFSIFSFYLIWMDWILGYYQCLHHSIDLNRESLNLNEYQRLMVK